MEIKKRLKIVRQIIDKKLYNLNCEDTYTSDEVADLRKLFDIEGILIDQVNDDIGIDSEVDLSQKWILPDETITEE
jgi:hypothetical protein